MYDLGYRFYDASLSRFLNVDPARDGSNWYAYCNNDPVNFVDWNGLKRKGSNATTDSKQEYDFWPNDDNVDTGKNKPERVITISVNDSPRKPTFNEIRFYKTGNIFTDVNPVTNFALDIIESTIDSAGFAFGILTNQDKQDGAKTGILGRTYEYGERQIRAFCFVGDVAVTALTCGTETMAKNLVQKEFQSLATNPGNVAKTGPKPFGVGPHNQQIAQVAGQITDGKIIAGGQTGLPEVLIKTPGGIKTGRRQDIFVLRPDNSTYGINVGKVNAAGAQITREAQALNDLEWFGDLEMFFVPYK